MSSDITAPEQLSITPSGALGIRWPDALPDRQALVVSATLLRACSPSAEQRQNPTLPQAVRICDLELMGHYGLKIAFDDGHDSGIYTWEYLADICRRREDLARQYGIRPGGDSNPG